MKAFENSAQTKIDSSEPEVRLATAQEIPWFDQQLGEHHYLGTGRPVGDHLRQVVTWQGKPVALLVWGPACYALKDRDLWIGWSACQRIERLKLVVQNRRFLLLTPKGGACNLASQVLGAALRVLRQHWQECFGYRPLLAETFTDLEAYAGTCYKASNWEPVGLSAGYSRHRADFYVPNERPKRLWLRPLVPEAREQLRAVQVPKECRGGLVASPSGQLPINEQEVESLRQVFVQAPDPRASNAQYRTAAVLTIIALALLAGRREIAEIVRFAKSLRQPQRRRLGLPRKKGTRAFYKVPGYDVFYQVLTRMDPEAFAALLTQWLRSRAGALPAALALDGKMIRDHIGLLSLVQHEDGSPQAVAVYDQKEGTERCELTAAQAMLESLEALDGQMITADPLHCQRKEARTIVEKGGDYLLQVKGNQKRLFKKAQKLEALQDTPFLNRSIPDTAGSKPANFMPSPSSPWRQTFASPEA
jgi:Domain of unknown function (DUF4338)/DDE_Tnp_1-associated